MRVPELVACQGSSPLTRGKLHVGHLLTWYLGLIPTHAGKTRRRASPPRSGPAHPHSRGENAMAQGQISAQEGSSPLTRGKLRSDNAVSRVSRLIPTHAGKTRRSRRIWRSNGAHPHSRGENLVGGQGHALAQGSSPLTRGKRAQAVRKVLTRGLIPTHAGKTCARSPRSDRDRAHPHSRGENVMSHAATLRRWGSSPLTRGKRFLTCAFIAQIGQILESRELCASSESYSLRNVYATDAPPDQVRSIGLVPLSSRGAS